MKYDEYQGFDKLWIAEVTSDTDEEYTTGTPEQLAPAGELSVTSNTETATKFYDNVPFLNVVSEGATELSITCPVLPLSIQAKITGKNYDETKKALLDSGQPTTKYFALMYRLMFTDGTYRYVTRNKCTISIGDESAKSKDDTTDSNGMTLNVSSISTTHTFTTTNKSSKAIIVDERDGGTDVSTWYTEVVTPDNLKAKVGV